MLKSIIMNRILLLLVLVAGISGSASAQSRWGLTTGLNYDLNSIGLDEALNSAQGILSGQTVDNGYHLGFFGRTFAGDQLYLGSKVLLAKDVQMLTYTDNGNQVTSRFDHDYLQSEAVVGLRLLKLVRAEAGLHYVASMTNNAFSQTFETPSGGYNVGLGVDVWKLSLDLVYYSSLKNHTGTWNGVPLSYERSQLLLSIGAKL
jgi:hypothetical protein